MGEVVHIPDWLAKKESVALPEAGTGITILAGEPTGRLCPHCQAVRVTALAMPHGLNGTACLDCDIFFDGDVDDCYKG